MAKVGTVLALCFNVWSTDFYKIPILMCCNFTFDIFLLLTNTVAMKTVNVTSLDPLRNFLVHIQEIDAEIAAQAWKAMHSIYV
jgi:hypothetical protein